MVIGGDVLLSANVLPGCDYQLLIRFASFGSAGAANSGKGSPEG